MRTIVSWLPSVAWMAVIFYLSSRTGDDVGGWLDEVRRYVPMMESFDWGHFISYFILALTFLWGIRPKRVTFRVQLVVVLLCVLYGITDEYHQSFIPGRTPDAADIRNDAVGAALAMLAARLPACKKRFESRAGAKYY